jgi:integrase
MVDQALTEARILNFPDRRKRQKKQRKDGLNRNREGSVRKINGKAYVDFIYLEERVRESSGLPWNDKNAKLVREQLDKIIVAIKSQTFRFAEVFPKSRHREHFAQKERLALGLSEKPEQVTCGMFFDAWYDLRKSSGRVTGRTLLGYRSYSFQEKDFGEMPHFERDKVPKIVYGMGHNHIPEIWKLNKIRIW